jgi:hypothetical protein
MCFKFDVSKCDKLFDVLLQNNIIKLKGGHVIPTAEQLAQKNIVIGMIHFLTQLMSAIIFINRSNRL